MHGFNRRKPESLAYAGEKEGLATAIEPHFLLVRYLPYQKSIPGLKCLNVLTNFFGILEMVVATNVEIMVREMAHHVNQEVEVFLRTHLPYGEKERLFRNKRWFTFRFVSDIFHAIVDHSERLALEVKMLLHLFGHKLGNASNGIGLIDSALQDEVMLQPTEEAFFSEIIKVVDGQDKLVGLPALVTKLLLRHRVPQISLRKILRGKLTQFSRSTSGFYLFAKRRFIVLGQQKVERQSIVLQLGIILSKTLLYLPEATSRIA